MKSGRIMARTGGVILALVAAGIAGCGSTGRREHHVAARHGPAATRDRSGVTTVGAKASLSSSAPDSLRQGALARVGTAQQVDAAGARLTVTLRDVIDPLRGAGARLARGSRAVAVVVQIRNAGPRIYDSSATGDVKLEVSGGVVTPVLATRGSCTTPLNDFDRYITAGEDRVGCVAFAVANGATLDAVWFSPHAHRLGRLTWAP